MMKSALRTFEIWLEIGVWDRDGKIIHRQKEPSRSPVKQFLELLLAQMKQSTVTTVVDTGGVSRSVLAHATNFGVILGLSQLCGIVIGTDNTAVDITDYQLGAQVTTGWVHEIPDMDSAVTVADPDCTFEMWRNFNNNTGSSVDIKETGIYCKAYSNFYFMLVRDIPTPITVPDGGGCYVKYTLKITE